MTKMNFESQFLESLKRYSKSTWDDADFYANPHASKGGENHVEARHDPFWPTLFALERQYGDKALRHLEALYHRTESPIEQAMLSALCIVANDAGENVWYKIDEMEFGDREYLLSNICIQPQAKIGKYRVDFLVVLEEYDPITKVLEGKNVFDLQLKREQVIVECDGHEFHEKTKEQAQSDKQRDRALQLLGFRVFRFTGSEIWRDALGCGKEVISAGQELLKSGNVDNKP